MAVGEVMSYVSVALAIVFWILTGKQANEAKKTLNEVKDAMLTWQAELNKVSIDILSSRPEVIAKQTSLEEAKAKAEFSNKMASIIEEISQNPSNAEDGGGYNINVLERLLEHNKSITIEKEKIMAQAVTGRSSGDGNN